MLARLLWDNSQWFTAGGDVNVTDEDGDTPLYTVETLEVAQWLVEHGAIVDRVNAEGISVCIYFLRLYPSKLF
jgi:uncharacterized protein